MNCPICDEKNWKDLDYFRNYDYWYQREYVYDEKIGFQICMNCGFVTYEKSDPKKLHERYERERVQINHANILTTNRKMVYHRHFLDETFRKMKVEKRNKVFDYGCAQGTFLGWLKGFYQFDVEGSEWSQNCINYAKNRYGVKVYDNMDDVKDKYDLIVCYHVLEHLQDPDKELLRMKSMLNEDGLIYLSVPIWFDILQEASRRPCDDFENLFHLNHINVFSKFSLMNILTKCGFEVVKTDVDMYGYTVLVKPTDKKGEIYKENPEMIIDIIKAQKEAIELFMDCKRPPHLRKMEGKTFEDALKVYPKYPEAYIGMSVQKGDIKSLESRMRWINQGLKAMPNNAILLLEKAKIYQKFDKGVDGYTYTNNIKTSEKLFLELLNRIPYEEIYWFLGVINARYKKDGVEASKWFKQLMEINPTRWTEIENYLGKCYTQ